MKSQLIAMFVISAVSAACGQITKTSTKSERSGKDRPASTPSKPSPETRNPKNSQPGRGIYLKMPSEVAAEAKGQTVGEDAALSKAFSESFASSHLRIACDDQTLGPISMDQIKGQSIKGIFQLTLTSYGEMDLQMEGRPAPASKGDQDEALALTQSEGDVPASEGKSDVDNESEVDSATGKAGGTEACSEPDRKEAEAREKGSECDVDGEESTSDATGQSDAPTEKSDELSDASDDLGESESDTAPAWTETLIFPYTCENQAVLSLVDASTHETFILDAQLYTADGYSRYDGSTGMFTFDQKGVALDMHRTSEQSSIDIQVNFAD